MLKLFVAVVLLLVTGLLIYAATKPDSFRIERSTTIKAQPEKVFALINDFHQWEAWSPWEKIDPALKRTYSGPPSGAGAVYEWAGNREIGQGRMEIVESTALSKVSLKLDFVTPFEAHNFVDFTLTQQGDSTKVTQAMYGPSPYISKLMTIFFSMEKMVGSKYEEGLADLKKLAEK